MVSVLFVCSGNICRSPMAEGLFRHLVEQRGLHESITADSAGTDVVRSGQPPHPHAHEACRQKGIDISQLESRFIVAADFRQFDYILAMDEQVLSKLNEWRPRDCGVTLALVCDYLPRTELREVPDPISGGPEDFEQTLEIIGAACEVLLDTIKKR